MNLYGRRPLIQQLSDAQLFDLEAAVPHERGNRGCYWCSESYRMIDEERERRARLMPPWPGDGNG